MGAGASADQARATVNTLLSGKPADASDIKDLEAARNEIRQLRRLASDFQNKLREELSAAGKDSNKGGKVKREAVYDKGDKVDKASSKAYVPKVIEKKPQVRELLMNNVTTNVLFSSYSKDEQNAIVDAFEAKSFAAEEYIIRQGENGEEFYVIQSGLLNIWVKGASGQSTKVNTQLGPGQSFGELALMYNTPRAASIQANTDCVVWCISRSIYRGIIQHHKFLRNKQYMEFLRNVVIMDKKLGALLSETELEKVTVSLERETYEPGDAIIRQGNKGDHFYIIAEGTVDVFKTNGAGKDEKLVTLSQGAYFGEKALLSEDLRQASCIANSKVMVLTLARDDFIDMMGSMEELMSGDSAGRAAETAKETASLAAVIGAASLDVKLKDLEIKATLGCGAFGRVKLCRLPAKDQFFALKCQSKKAIVESGLQEHVLNEMRVMKIVDHPFIARLYASLQDDRYIYFLLELLQGGELFTHLRNKGKISEQAARFYGAIVVYAYSVIHARKIAYRDLKPENLVMDSRGYVKLVDFGLAKQLLEGKTWTLCGTPDYLAPEIILNEGHDHCVDYWALGVLIFEMVVGAPPFYAEDPMEVYEKILSGNPPIPSFFTRNLSDLIKKLLRSHQTKRLGNTRGGTAAVVKHKWFSSFDWAQLETGEMKPPHVPNVGSKDDINNFDTASFEEAEQPATCDWQPDLS